MLNTLKAFYAKHQILCLAAALALVILAFSLTIGQAVALVVIAVIGVLLWQMATNDDDDFKAA